MRAATAGRVPRCGAPTGGDDGDGDGEESKLRLQFELELEVGVESRSLPTNRAPNHNAAFSRARLGRDPISHSPNGHCSELVPHSHPGASMGSSRRVVRTLGYRTQGEICDSECRAVDRTIPEPYAFKFMDGGVPGDL